MSIVIDIGNHSVRCGRAGDESPLESPIIIYQDQYIANIVEPTLPPHFQLENIALTTNEKSQLKDQLLEDPIVSKVASIYTSDISILSLQDRLQSVLVQQLRTLLVSPYVSKYVTILVEPAFSSKSYKQQILKLLSHKLNLKLQIWIPEPVSETMAANSTNSMVLHLGWLATIITSVIDLRVISQMELCNNFCGQALHYKFIEYLLRDSNDFRDLLPSLKPHQLYAATQKFFQSVAYVDSDSENVNLLFSIGNFQYQVGTLLHKTIENCLQSTNIIDKIAHHIQTSAIDIRPIVSSNIIILGGLSQVPGMKQYIFKLLKKKLPDSRCIVSLGLWSGASIYSSLLTKNELKSLLKQTE